MASHRCMAEVPEFEGSASHVRCERAGTRLSAITPRGWGFSLMLHLCPEHHQSAYGEV